MGTFYVLAYLESASELQKKHKRSYDVWTPKQYFTIKAWNPAGICNLMCTMPPLIQSGLHIPSFIFQLDFMC